MIQIDQEQLVAIRDVPKLLPKRRNGKYVHVSAVYRWISRGVRDVVLESVKIGGQRYTSVEALQRFADRLSDTATAVPKPRQTPLSRQRAIARAAEELERILGGARHGS